jgi:hypothetical protein
MKDQPAAVTTGSPPAAWQASARASRSAAARLPGQGPSLEPAERSLRCNAYVRGSYHYHEPPRTGERREFWGMATWSGTSFATPVVAGLIAARMSRTGENGRRAAGAVLAAARAQAVPGVGPVLGAGPVLAHMVGTSRVG